MTDTFRDRPFHERFQAMGDQAEAVFEEWATNVANRGFERYGLDRPAVSMARLPRFICYTPDYLMSSKLVEVQGCGRDQTFKFKHDKLEVLGEWSQIHPVELFVFDSTNNRSFLAPLEDVMAAAVADEFESGTFPDNQKQYYKISTLWFLENGHLL